MDKAKGFDLADVAAQISALDMGSSCVSSPLPHDTTVTMAYVPYQLDRTSYTPEQALQKGTLFKCLNKEFYGRSVADE